MVRRHIEKTLVHAWHNQSSWLILFRPLSLLYYLLLTLKNFWFQRLSTAVTLKARTIIIGNISVGGSGKTSVTASIAAMLTQQHYTVAVISKGYGRTAPHPYPVVVDTMDPQRYGDEPCLLAQQLSCPVVVCDDRLKALAAWHDKVHVLICDDGLQDYRFIHDCEIALIDGDTGFGNHKLLPEGFLREPVSRLDQCHLVLQLAGKKQLRQAQALFHYHAIGCRHILSNNFISIEQARTQWHEQQIEAFAGLANNRRFFSFLHDLGFTFQAHSQPDHYSYSVNDFADLSGIKLMTAKDAVKCHSFADESFWYLEIDTQFDQDTHTMLNTIMTGQ